MKVYVDNNILVLIEKGQIDIDQFKCRFSSDAKYLYSYVHILELLEATELRSLMPKRITTIKLLTNESYVYSDLGEFRFKSEKIESVIEINNQAQTLLSNFRNSTRLFDFNQKEILEYLGVSKKELNNVNPESVIEHLNSVLKSRLIPNLNQVVLLSSNRMHEQFVSFFNFLDLLGYWTDKVTERSNLARVYDASHSYFSSACDYFISNDLRTRNKAKVIFDFYGVKTKVLSYIELIESGK